MIGSGILERLKPYFRRTPKARPAARPAADLAQPTPAQQAAARPAGPAAGAQPAAATALPPDAVAGGDLVARHETLARQLAELQWDLGGLAYEMAIRDHFRLDLLVRKAAEQRAVDTELAALERIMRLEQAGAAGYCPSCGALYSRGAVFCWQCGSTLTPAVAPPPQSSPTPRAAVPAPQVSRAPQAADATPAPQPPTEASATPPAGAPNGADPSTAPSETPTAPQGPAQAPPAQTPPGGGRSA